MATDARTISAWRSRTREGTLLRGGVAFASQHPVWTIFLLALGIRVLVAVGIAIVNPHEIAPDGIGYSNLAAQAANGHTSAWSAYYHWLYTRTGALLVPLTGLYELFGVHQLVGQLLVGLLGAVTAALTTRLAMELTSKRWAILAGLIVALLPSQVVWSSLILKDPMVWMCLAGMAVTIAVAGRSSGLRLLALGLVAGGLLVVLGYLRFQTMVVAAWALMLAAVVGPRVGRIPRVGGAIALGVLIPWLAFSLGPAGVLVVNSTPPPSQQRALSAQGANSPIAGSDLGDQGELRADIGHLPTGLSAMLIQPYPWRAGGSVYLNLARIQDLIWYPLLLLAFVGLVMLRRRHLRVMAFPVIAGGTILILYALTEGNLGTAFRHRGEFEWVIALLAGFGLLQLVSRRAQRRATFTDVPSAG